MSSQATTSTVPGVFDRVLGLRQGEHVAVGWSFVYFFCVLSAYYMLRPVRETMAVESGVGYIPLLFSTTFVVMLLVAPVFGWVASRFPRKRFLPWVYLFFIINILLFYGGFTYAMENGHSFVWLGRVFFVWISVFNLFVVSVFWSFMADIYTHEQGRRLFGVISAGGSAGALIGPIATSALVVPIGFQNLLPVSAALLLFAVFCITRLRRWVESGHEQELKVTAASSRPLGGTALGGLKAVSKSRYLLAISMGSVIASLMGTALYMFMTQLVGAEIAGADERTRLFGYIDGATNGLALVGQLLLVNRAVHRFGVGLTLAILPLVSLAGFAVLAISPALIAVAILQAVRRGIGFGFAKPTSDMLYSVVTPEEKYKAKNFIDTAVYRGGDLIGTWSVKFVWALGISGISLLMLPMAVAWLVIALWLGRDYQRRDRLGIGGD
jgi:AAA family ATP:ADP antiporter